jgi:hypothetical protein
LGNAKIEALLLSQIIQLNLHLSIEKTPFLSAFNQFYKNQF